MLASVTNYYLLQIEQIPIIWFSQVIQALRLSLTLTPKFQQMTGNKCINLCHAIQYATTLCDCLSCNYICVISKQNTMQLFATAAELPPIQADENHGKPDRSAANNII